MPCAWLRRRNMIRSMLWTKMDLGWVQWSWKRRALLLAIPGLSTSTPSSQLSVMNRVDQWGCRNRWLRVVPEDRSPAATYYSNHLMNRLQLEFKTKYPFSIL